MLVPKGNKNLVFIIDSIFPAHSGGRENWLYEICKRLHKKYNIIVISMRTRQRDFYPISDLDLKIYRLPSFTLPLPSRFSFWSYFLKILSFSLITAAFIFLRFISKKEKTIFFVLNPGPLYLPLLFMRKKSFRRVFSSRGNWAIGLTQMYPPLKSLFELAQIFTCKDADMVLANGYDTYEQLKPFSTNLRLMPNGVDFKRFSSYKKGRSERNHKVIVSIANLRDIKGISHLIKSIPYILERYNKPFKVRFVGFGNITFYLDLAKKLNVEKFVEFIGEQRDIPKILHEADISATLSNPDTGGGGMSQATLESMAAGKPIIAWDNNTYQQLLKHKYSGYLVTPPGDPKALGKGLAYLLKNEDFCEYIRKNAQEDAKKFDYDILSKRLSDYFEELYY